MFVHLGSMSSSAAAEGEQQRIWAAHDILSDILPGIYKVHVNGADYYRVLGVVSNREKGARICDALAGDDGAPGCSVIQM